LPRITPVDPAESEGTNREVFEQFLKERGNIPNMMRTMGLSPEHLRTMVAHFRTVMNTGTVPRLLKEMIAVRVSRINACDYCLASHTVLARRLGATESQLDALLDLGGAGAGTAS
jgi:AhpD family alkylhydroperoxidase